MTGQTLTKQSFSSPLDGRLARIKEHERLAAIILDGMYHFVALLDAHGNILEVNRAALEGAGHNIEEIRDRPFWTTRWWQVSQRIQEDLQAAIRRAAAGQFIRYEVDIYDEESDFEPITIDFSLQPIHGDSGMVEYLLAESRNLTEHDKTRKELEQRKVAEQATALLAAIVHSSDDAIISKDLNGIITTWNNSAERTFGFTAEEAIGRPVTILMPPDRLDEEPTILERVRSGQRVEHYETVRRRKDGTLLDISLTISPIYNSQGQIIGASKIARNIGDRKRIEATLLKAHGLAAAGRMSASIAHEINNPLAAVTNLLYLLRSEVSDEIAARNLAMAESELARVARITKKTLAYFRDTSTPVSVDLSELITDTLAIFVRKIADKRIEVVRTDQPCTVAGLKGELQQLFSNLIANAVDAVDRGGRIDIAIFEDDDAIAVTVRDNGMGISPDHSSRLFEPFFTTKEQHMGTGLGLWISKEIAQKHGAKISVESSTDIANHGTAFTVSFSNRQRLNA